jgi:DNA-binding transcriptional ArsR family regulator
VRVVDLRASAPPATPTIEVRTSSGVELLRLLGVLLTSDGSEFDVGAERLDRIRERVPSDLLDDARSFVTCTAADGEQVTDEKLFVVLSLLAVEIPEPGGVAELVAHLEAHPDRTWRMLLAHHAQELPGKDTDELALRIEAGDREAIDAICALAEDEACPAGLRSLLEHQPEEHTATIVDLVTRFDVAIWRELEAEAMGPIERDAAHRLAQLDAGVDAAQVVLDATNGYELTDDPTVERVVLVPSYWFRPWLVIGRMDARTEVLSTVVAEEFLTLPSEAPPPSLLKLFKALSDEGRLRLLRRMSAGPISLADASDELDVAKATAHHHLSILRQAGLVLMRGEGRATRYALREDPATAATEALAAYVPPRRSS